MSSSILDTDILDEVSPLLRRKSASLSTQTLLVLFQQLTVRIALQSIYPYINQLLSELDITGGNEKKVGYYVGLIDSAFYLIDAITTLHWCQASDYVGRKPILIIGLFGTSFSMLCFGLSRTFSSLLLSRCICGVFNGNIGVLKSVIGETTDATNRARAFSLISVVWAAGTTVGPLIGGSLSRPHERFPSVFTHPFWVKYTYFFPSAVAAGFTIFGVFIIFIFFKETNPTISNNFRDAVSSGSTHRRPQSEGPVPMKDVITYRVVISICNLVALTILSISAVTLTPLFFFMPIDIGGLGLSSLTVGFIMSVYGAATGLYQAFFFSAIVRRFGERRIIVLGIIVFIPIFLLFPAASLIARLYGINIVIAVLVTVQLCLLAFTETAYGCIYVYISASARNQRSLGATNGLSQIGSSLALAIGPAMATSLFSLSVDMNILYGYGVYAILASLSITAVVLAIQLPAKVWDTHESDHDREE